MKRFWDQVIVVVLIDGDDGDDSDGWELPPLQDKVVIVRENRSLTCSLGDFTVSQEPTGDVNLL